MRLITRIFSRDIIELCRSYSLLALLFVVPLVLLLLIGNLNVHPTIVRVAVSASGADPTAYARLQSALGDLAFVRTSSWSADGVDARQRAVLEDMDLVVAWEVEDWHFYTPITKQSRLQIIRGVVEDVLVSIQRSKRSDEQLRGLRAIARFVESPAGDNSAEKNEGAAPEAKPDSPATLKSQAESAVEMLQATAQAEAELSTPLLRDWLSTKLIPYFPPGSQADHSLVPGFIALMVVFLPFLLAAGAVAREREAGTLETLTLVARRRWHLLAAGKMLMPIFVSIIAWMLLLLAAYAAFGYAIKPGILQAFGVQGLAAATSAVLGFSISTMIKSAHDSYTASAVYLVGCILLTGLFYPIDQAARGVVAVAYLFPLTLSGQPLEDWMLKGASASVSGLHWAALVAQLLMALIVCALSLRRLRDAV